MLKVTNTLTGKKEVFTPLDKNSVKMYVCGITPYDFAHIGHGRVAVVFDLVYRLFKYLDCSITYCRNFTDIDDKLLLKAEKELGDQNKYLSVATKYIESYTDDVKKLQCLDPDYEPRVTENIQDIISFISHLIDNEKAYVVKNDVYFSIASFPAYARLSKHDLKNLRSGSRVQVNTQKKDPLDFVLWKGNEEERFWKSPWGYGRPGWHIECSVLAKKFLGTQIDIHGGGMDLIFPHHDNEIAQSESLHKKTFVNYWMHNAFVRIDKEKMSKSLGNFFTLKDVFKKFDPIIVRFYLLNHYYRAPLDFSFDDLESLQKSYKRLCLMFDHVKNDLVPITTQESKQSTVVQKMLQFITDDLNTPGMLGVLFEHSDLIKNNKKEAAAVKFFVNEVLGLPLEKLDVQKIEITPEIQSLIDTRIKARKEKNWKVADEIRDTLQKMGVVIEDKKL